MKKKEINDVPLTKEFQLVANPELIRVLAIKESFIDQMEMIGGELIASARIIGRTGAFIICHLSPDRGDNRIVKLHVTDFTDWLRGKRMGLQSTDSSGRPSLPAAMRSQIDQVWNEVQEEVSKLPQLFKY